MENILGKKHCVPWLIHGLVSRSLQHLQNVQRASRICGKNNVRLGPDDHIREEINKKNFFASFPRQRKQQQPTGRQDVRQLWH